MESENINNNNPLPSWNEGTTKNAIVNYVQDVINRKSENFIPVKDRIATFDNDGTLWAEKPNYFQAFFMKHSVKEKAPNNPKLKAAKYVKEVLNNEEKKLRNLSIREHLEVIAASYENETTIAFEESVLDWLKKDRHPELNVPFTDLIYQPMLELMDYLKAYDFKIFIISGGGIDFMRPWTESVYGISKEAVMGSSVQTEFDDNNGNPLIRRLNRIDFIDDKEGKPVGIHKMIGKKPVFACGNSDGDLQMMQWTDSNSHSSFQLYLHHTDAEREWAYDRASNVGQFDKGLDEAREKGWTIIDMKNDWSKVFPEVVKD